jgi:hypothetical protein
MGTNSPHTTAPLAGHVSGPLSEEERRSLAQQHFLNYLLNPDDDKPFVANSTKAERDRLWQLWNM